jgi:hypothetical protein
MELLFSVFGIVALGTLLIRAVAVRKGRHSLVTALFLAGLAVGVFGPVAKSGLVAPLLDRWLGANANWLIADGLFAASLTIATWWADVMSDAELRMQPARVVLTRLTLQKRNLALLAVTGLTIAGTRDPLWPTLEVGSTDLAGTGGGLLLARLAYHTLTIWALAYVARVINRYRAHLIGRREYIRYSTPVFGLLVATYAPAIQMLAELLAFFGGAALFHRWLPLISGVQGLAFAAIGLSALPRQWVYAAIDRYLEWEMARGTPALLAVHGQLCHGQKTDGPDDAPLRDIRASLVSLGFDPRPSLPAAGRCSEGWREAKAGLNAALRQAQLCWAAQGKQGEVLSVLSADGTSAAVGPGLPRDQAGLARLCASVTRNL